ncbi:DNA replication complex subunit Gins51 [Halostella pelagica]|uniref:DNA replication complex subunit Gins51 n=1 Tax=Halostella pelagica TaxID=2583824 RepID=UPI001081A29B|nr:hypothetical protein [Halostella pelagica]
MNLDELRSVQSKERQKDSLQHLRDSFYGDVGEYISELKDRRDSAAAEADDPFSNPDVGRLTDEIETAEEVVEAVYERRMGKIVKRASLAAAGMPADEEGLTTEEKELFGDIVDRIEANKDHVLDVLSGNATAESPTADRTEAETDAETKTDADDGVSAADLMGDGPDAEPDSSTASADPDSPSGEHPVDAESGVPDAIAEAERERAQSTEAHTGDGETQVDGDIGPKTSGGTSGDGRATSDEHADGPESDDSAASAGGDASDAGTETDRATVRITQDVGQILGIDEREYELAAEDVVQLPEQNVEPLVQRDAAERLD